MAGPDQSAGRVAFSAGQLQAIVDSALDAIVTIDATGAVTGWSRQAERTFGWSSAEATGRSLADLIIPPQHREAHRVGLARFMATGEGRIMRRRVEITALDKSGREFAVELVVTPFRDRDEWLFTGFIRDLSEVRKTARELAQRERHLRAIIETEPECVKLLDREGRLVDMNASGLAMIEADSLEQVRGLQVLSLITPADRPAFVALCRDVFAGKSGSLEFNVVGLKGSPRRLETRAVPLMSEDGRSPLLLGITRDVTERNRMEERLRVAQHMESVGRLAGGIAHDFNNLLTAILGAADAIDHSSGADHPGRQEVEEIRSAALRAADLTRQLLAFSRQQVLRPKVLDLNVLVTRMEKLLRRLIGEHVTLGTTLSPAIASVRADPGQLERVIVNLVLNARDVMPEGGAITIETALAEPAESEDLPAMPDKPFVRLVVRDDGPGIAPEVRPHLFEPFFTTKHPGRGAGLGLATVYGIVRQSDGYIKVESETGKGAAFSIYLPVVAEPADADDDVQPTVSPALGGHETILVAEDESAILSLVEAALRQRGYSVLSASSGTAAKELATGFTGTIDLLLTDVVMPGIGGRDLARSLKAKRPNLKVIFMSGYAGEDVVEMGVLERGADFIPKPFTPGELMSKVRAVLDGRAS